MFRPIRFLFLALSLVLLAPAAGIAQDITTADQYFNQVAERYAKINDYEAKVSITTGRDTMLGTLAYKSPALLRIDFSKPADQVIAFNGNTLTVYIPEYRAVLSQEVGDKPSAGTAGSLASSEGLRMMKRSYTVAFESSPEPVALVDSPGEAAVCLLLNRRTVAEGFKTIKLYITPATKLIRRIEGWTLSGEKLVFDFTSIQTNIGMPESRFIYDSPASANRYNNFLFKTDN